MGIRDLVLIVSRGPDARATLQVGVRTGPTLQISVATDSGEVGWAGGEVVRRQVRGKIIMVVVPRSEGAVRAGATVPGELFGDVMVIVGARGGLPVDGLQAVIRRP